MSVLGSVGAALLHGGAALPRAVPDTVRRPAAGRRALAAAAEPGHLGRAGSDGTAGSDAGCGQVTAGRDGAPSGRLQQPAGRTGSQHRPEPSHQRLQHRGYPGRRTGRRPGHREGAGV